MVLTFRYALLLKEVIFKSFVKLCYVQYKLNHTVTYSGDKNDISDNVGCLMRCAGYVLDFNHYRIHELLTNKGTLLLVDFRHICLAAKYTRSDWRVRLGLKSVNGKTNFTNSTED